MFDNNQLADETANHSPRRYVPTEQYTLPPRKQRVDTGKSTVKKSKTTSKKVFNGMTR